MWRAFVYSEDSPTDRIKQAYEEFEPLDGQFDENVLVQAKNGPLDFQPREPFSPLFGRLPNTNAMMEFQITKEYLGFATHLTYLGPQWEETLKSDTHARGPGSTVAKVVDGSLFNRPLTGMAGVANTGTSPSWSGSIFNQANWYAFGRLAWNPDLSARDIAEAFDAAWACDPLSAFGGVMAFNKPVPKEIAERLNKLQSDVKSKTMALARHEMNVARARYNAATGELLWRFDPYHGRNVRGGGGGGRRSTSRSGNTATPITPTSRASPMRAAYERETVPKRNAATEASESR